MTISLEYEAKEQLNFDYNELIKKVVIGCLDFENCPYEVEVSIILTNDNEIKLINKEFRGLDKATDVLSFPTIEYGVAGDFSDLEEEDFGCFNPETGELILGDIMISVERAIEQAETYGHSLEREIAFLTAHSMFHLMGYDHMSDEERREMEAKQEKLLEGLEIRR